MRGCLGVTVCLGASIRKPLPCRTLVFDPGCAREPVLESEQSLACDSKGVDFPKENYPNQIVQVRTVWRKLAKQRTVYGRVASTRRL